LQPTTQNIEHVQQVCICSTSAFKTVISKTIIVIDGARARALCQSILFSSTIIVIIRRLLNAILDFQQHTSAPSVQFRDAIVFLRERSRIA
jgi:hypothetical protein